MRDYVVLDVFTRTPLEGNPLAVFLDGAGLSAETMQRTARELNLSETVFLLDGEQGTDARLRIFTPGAELPFAGHPTLGAAFVIGARTGRDELRLLTGAGVVALRLEREGDEVVRGEMEQPLPVPEPLDGRDALLEALGVERSVVPVGAFRNGPLHTFVQLEHAAAVDALAPDLGVIARLIPGGVSCYAMDGGHVHARVFVPSLGVPEDPATGSAAGPLAVHLANHGSIGFGEWVEIRQGVVMGRPSLLRARVDGSADRIERVLVGGGAVVVAEGALPHRLSAAAATGRP
jgi:trans-2,3-dihydro-3-hydroxyanthranilate isomerase